MYFEFFEYLDEISFIFFLTYSSYFFSYLSSKIILLNFLNIGIKKSLLNLLTFNCSSSVDRTKLLDDKKYNLYIKIQCVGALLLGAPDCIFRISTYFFNS